MLNGHSWTIPAPTLLQPRGELEPHHSPPGRFRMDPSTVSNDLITSATMTCNHSSQAIDKTSSMSSAVDRKPNLYRRDAIPTECGTQPSTQPSNGSILREARNLQKPAVCCLQSQRRAAVMLWSCGQGVAALAQDLTGLM